MTKIPRFAVVGHPNKGKSSLVATLARDEHVPVGEMPGTTTRAEVYPLQLAGEVLYELIDTPGFQRPREVLAWLKAHDSGSATRPQTVQMFLDVSEHRRRYPDECQLLEPIANGAAILYVVDGSVPFTEEYEVELEILRWTASPRMGIVNPISNEAYVEEWKTALGQFCSTVRVFNPLTADFAKCIELLEVAASLDERWTKNIRSAVQVLKEDREQAIAISVVEILDLLVKSVGLVLELPVQKSAEPGSEESLARFAGQIRQLEEDARNRIEHAFHYRKLSRLEEPLTLLEEADALSHEAWKLFGLSRWQLTRYSAVAGVAAGGLVDAMTGGASLAVGAAAGGLIGGGAAWLLAERLVDRKLVYLPLGKRLMRIGPVKSSQFGFVIFNRARLHLAIVATRAHADRRVLSLSEVAARHLEPLSEADNKLLFKLFRSLRQQKFDEKDRKRLQSVVDGVLRRDLEK